MKTIIEKLIKNKEDLIKNFTKMNPETSEYYDGYYCGKIEELKESIIELKSILRIVEFKQSIILDLKNTQSRFSTEELQEHREQIKQLIEYLEQLEKEQMTDLRDKKLGTLVGLAVGDAMGAPYEFLAKGRYTPTREYNTGGVHDVSIGEWTDDTSMALCLAQSLIDKGFDELEQLNNYLKWYKEGYMCTRSRCFDIGNATRNAIVEFDNTGRKIRKTKTGNFQTNGNGTIMRLAPVIMKYAEDKNLLDYATKSSLTTHKGIEAHQSACLLAEIIRNCCLETDKIKILENRTNVFNNNFIKDIIEEYQSSYENGFYPTIPTGYCIDTLQCAIQGFLYYNNFIDGLMYCISLGDDTDTVGAVYGQIAGAYYGLSGIPDYYKENLMQYNKILEIGNKLIDLSESN